MAHIIGILSSLLLFVTGILCQNSRPVFTNVGEGDMLYFSVSEDLKVGDLAFRLTADDADGDQIRFSIISNKFRIEDPVSGEVVLNQKLNYELEPTINIQVAASDRGGMTRQNAMVEVIDVNDELPQFREDYEATIPESTVSGTVIISPIIITDADQQGNTLEVTCLYSEPQIDNDPCDYFRLVEQESSRSEWRGEMTTIRGIDYEVTPSFQVQVLAFDGKNSMIKTFEVIIENEQDTPPEFIGPLSATVEEDLTAESVVMTLLARDGDVSAGEVGRAIRYEIEPGSDTYNLFEIDSVTGTIRLTRDINTVNLPRNFITLNVVAREVVSGNQLGSTLGLTATQAQVIINIRDSSKLPPAFEPNELTTYVVEKCTGTEQIAILNLVQRDQSSVSEYELYLGTYEDLFTVSPQTASGSREVYLSVIDNCKLDYDQGQSEYQVIVYAREKNTVARLQGQVKVEVKLQDGNDNDPRFSQSNYQARVPENAQAGQPVTTVTATDLDSGANADICYKLDPPSSLFSINYKTGEITVKSCPTPGSGDCLDYERQQLYKLNVVGRDKCGEGRLSNTTVSVSVIDRNDNPPEFTEQNYVTSIIEGQTDPDVQVTAVDPDGGSNIRYV